MATAEERQPSKLNKPLALEEGDIPGAILPRDTPEECNMIQLKRWLLCRGASTSGRKQQLVGRVKDYMKSGLAAKNLTDPDGGVNLAKKKAQLGILDVVEPELTTSFPAEGFSESLADLPNVNFKTVWTYMVSCLDAKKQLSTAKPLVKGFNFFKSGHVLSVKSNNKDNKTYLKSQVLPSMKKTSAYSCFIILRKQGLVQRAYCGCPAGIDGRCNHVAATLFCLEEFCKVRATQIVQQAENGACTSNPCKWNIPRKRKGDVVPISQMKFQKHDYGKDKSKRVLGAIPQGYDVRAPHQRNFSNTKLYEIYYKVKQFEEKKGKVLGLSHTLKQSSPEEQLSAANHDHCYSITCNANSKADTVDDSIISPIKFYPVSREEIQSRCERVKRALFVTEEKATAIETQTRDQSTSQEWYKQRKYRITASMGYRCAALKQSTSPSKALREVLGYNGNFTSEAMKAGLAQEPEIISQYLQKKSQSGNSSVTVERCGFFVSPSHSFLGASPDGLVTDNGESGLLELKYIQTFESETLEEALIRKRICISQNGIHLHNKHRYFYQVQQQMFVSGKLWCDFVVKGSTGGPLFVERIHFDNSFWNPVLEKLDFFFHTHMLPEIAYPTLKNGGSRLELREL